MKKSMGMVGAIVVTLAILVIPAQATPVLNFTISVGGPDSFIEDTGGSLWGHGIPVTSVVGIDTPLNSGVTANLLGNVDNPVTLDFITSFPINSTTWGGPGDGISLTGGVDFNNDGDLNDPGDIAAGTVLFNGFFGFVTVTPLGNNQYSVYGEFTDNKNPQLTAFYGLPSTGYNGTFSLTFTYDGSLPSGFKARELGEGTITNSTPVPEPGSLILIGSGLIAAFGISRYRKSR
jgi:hypothetical protein